MAAVVREKEEDVGSLNAIIVRLGSEKESADAKWRRELEDVMADGVALENKVSARESYFQAKLEAARKDKEASLAALQIDRDEALAALRREHALSAAESEAQLAAAVKDREDSLADVHRKHSSNDGVEAKLGPAKEKEEALSDAKKQLAEHMKEWKQKLVVSEKERWEALAHVKREHGDRLKEWKQKLVTAEAHKKDAVEHLTKKHQDEYGYKLRAAEREREEAVEQLSMKHSDLVAEHEAKLQQLKCEKEYALRSWSRRGPRGVGQAHEGALQSKRTPRAMSHGSRRRTALMPAGANVGAAKWTSPQGARGARERPLQTHRPREHAAGGARGGAGLQGQALRA